MNVWNNCPICDKEITLFNNKFVLGCGNHYVIVLDPINGMIRNDFIYGKPYSVSRFKNTTYIYFDYPNNFGNELAINKVFSFEECLNQKKLEMLFLLS